ncbi:MAG: tyrosine-type recombinase/integrase [Firmicutes bacterium]|nr:tyrosine-type recombinase/integrase [Bacillota bacterium]
MQSFIDYLKESDASPHTIKSYISDLKKFMKWYVETTGEELKDFNAVGSLHVAEFKRYLITRGQKPATINRALAALSVFFSWLTNQGLADQNPVIGIISVKQERTSPKALDRREQMALMKAVRSSGKVRDIALVTLLLHTGLRISELCALDVEDMVLRERSGWLTVMGKGLKVRTVPLNATVRNALEAWLKVRGRADGPLFTSQKKGGLTARAVEYLLAKYARLARLEGVTPHSLRHTFCKSLIDAGESIDRVAMLAGHSNLNTTSRYTRPTDKDLQNTVDKLAWE